MSNALLGYALMCHWDYGKRKKFGMEATKIYPTYIEAQRALAKLLVHAQRHPDSYLRGFGAEIVVVHTLTEDVQ